MTSPRSRRTVLEVERKFSRLQVYPLTADGGNPAIRDLKYLGVKSFRDIYFDDRNLMSRAGSWVRQRDGIWETKVAQAGDSTDSQFYEIYDLDKIRDHVQSITGHSQPPSESFGLLRVADITTRREAWLADGRFTIVLDRTDFDHMVGEVELEIPVDEGSDAEARNKCSLMNSDIGEFMQRYAWAFDTSPVVDKLTAYFTWRNASDRKFTAT